MKLSLQVKNLPSESNLFTCNFASTYWMEIWKGPREQSVKVYESELFCNEFTKDFNIEMTDA